MTIAPEYSALGQTHFVRLAQLYPMARTIDMTHAKLKDDKCFILRINMFT